MYPRYPKYVVERSSKISIALFQEPIFLLYLFPYFFFTSTNCIYWMILFSFSSQFEPNLLPHVQLNFSNKTRSVSQPSPLSKRLNFLYSQFCNRTKIASLAAQLVKNQPAMQETQVQSLGREDSLEKKMATHSGILVWRIPWTEEPGRLQFMVSQRVGHWLSD